jgi:hypothetical protein
MRGGGAWARGHEDPKPDVTPNATAQMRRACSEGHAPYSGRPAGLPNRAVDSLALLPAARELIRTRITPISAYLKTIIAGPFWQG